MDKMSSQSSTQHRSHGKDHENQHPPAPAERLPHVIPFEDKCICQFDYLDLRLHSLSLFSSPCKAISHPPTRKPQKMPGTASPRPPAPTSWGTALLHPSTSTRYMHRRLLLGRDHTGFSDSAPQRCPKHFAKQPRRLKAKRLKRRRVKHESRSASSRSHQLVGRKSKEGSSSQRAAHPPPAKCFPQLLWRLEKHL